MAVALALYVVAVSEFSAVSVEPSGAPPPQAASNAALSRHRGNEDIFRFVRTAGSKEVESAANTVRLCASVARRDCGKVSRR
jgi:hypothetical protein